jgi:ubiquitin C-terminal hydrolase
VSEREEEEVDLSFIMPEPNVSLNYCISTYSKEEKLSGRDKFKCDRCGDLVEAGKCSLIKTLPNFLSVHLRRFKYDEAKRGITKLNWQICFPYKLKIKTNYWEKAGQPEKDKEGLYRLVGVVVHLGTG